uniref:Uncharacterized protein n=1 Tax=Arundo donax TaxID=35708 RepID=A0A0A9AVL2_ARUDO
MLLKTDNRQVLIFK